MSRWSPEKRRAQRKVWKELGLCSNCGRTREDEMRGTCLSCRRQANLRDAKATVPRKPMPMSTRAGLHARAIVEAARQFREFLRFKDTCPKADRVIVDSMAKESLQQLIGAVAEYERQVNRPINIKRRALKILLNRRQL